MIIDTRDLMEERDELIASIEEEYERRFDEVLSYDEIEDEEFLEEFKDHLDKIAAINNVEDEVGSEFDYGTELIPEDEFEDYCRDLLVELGYIPEDFPSWIEIDYEATANNMSQDYSMLTYDGEEYYYRS